VGKKIKDNRLPGQPTASQAEGSDSIENKPKYYIPAAGFDRLAALSTGPRNNGFNQNSLLVLGCYRAFFPKFRMPG
jgi:hypothetical protein